MWRDFNDAPTKFQAKISFFKWSLNSGLWWFFFAVAVKHTRQILMNTSVNNLNFCEKPRRDCNKQCDKRFNLNYISSDSHQTISLRHTPYAKALAMWEFLKEHFQYEILGTIKISSKYWSDVLTTQRARQSAVWGGTRHNAQAESGKAERCCVGVGY